MNTPQVANEQSGAYSVWGKDLRHSMKTGTRPKSCHVGKSRVSMPLEYDHCFQKAVAQNGLSENLKELQGKEEYTVKHKKTI